MKIEIDLKNVSKDEVVELKDYLENNCWSWKEKENAEEENGPFTKGLINQK
jgi:hypothetical protein